MTIARSSCAVFRRSGCPCSRAAPTCHAAHQSLAFTAPRQPAATANWHRIAGEIWPFRNGPDPIGEAGAGEQTATDRGDLATRPGFCGAAAGGAFICYNVFGHFHNYC
jgi:hypothetical protein